MTFFRYLFWILSFCALTSCSKVQNSSKDLTVMLSGTEIAGLDPAIMETDTGSYRIGYQIYDRLTQEQKPHEFGPSPVVSHIETKSLSTLRFFLKKGVLFHNGEELTSQDVIFSLKRAKSSPLTFRFFNIIKKMKIINRYVFDLESTGSSKHLLEYLSQVPASIISKIAYHKDPKNFPFHPVGSGAFELQDWSVNNFVRLKRFSKNDKLKNINGSSLIQSIRFIWVSHDVSKQLALKSQRVDLIFEVPPRDALQIESLKNSFIKLYSFPSATFNILGFNHLNPLFNDPHLKKTILRIIDRKEITQNLYAHFAAIPSSFSLYKTGSPASAFIVKSITNNSNILKLLREKPLKLITLNDPKRSTMATILQYQFAKKGIKIEITKYSWPAFIKAVEKKDFDLILFAESARFYYPLYFFQLIVDFNKNTDNLLFYKNKSVHLLIQDLLITRNTTKEKALITNILNLLAQDLPFIPLNNPSQIIAYQNNIRGLVFQSDGVIDFTNTSKISFK